MIGTSSGHWRTTLLWFLLALAAGLLFARTALPGIAPASDLWDYSQEARQISRGEGFTSLYTYPVSLGNDQPPFPVAWRMPLYAAIGALLLRLGISLPAGFLYFGAFAHALLVALTYLLAARLHSTRAGSWAAACALACPLLLDFYNAGMSQVAAAALGLVVWILLLGRRSVAATVPAAFAAATAWYLRGESMLFVPLWLWVAAKPSPRTSPRWSRALVFLLVYVALCLPWLMALRHQGFMIQSPILLYTTQFPGYTSSRMLGTHLPSMVEYVARYPGSFAVRVAKDLFGYTLDLLDGLGPVALGLAFAGIALRGFIVPASAVRRYLPLLIAIALQLLAMSALERSPRFLVPALPLIFVMIGVAAAPALGKVASSRAVMALLLLVILERGAHVVYQRKDALRRYPPVSASTAAALEQDARAWPRGGLVLSDAPDWIAWHLDRHALFLPLMREVDSLSSARQVDAIWLSHGARDRNVADRDTAWVGKMDRNEPLRGFGGPDMLPGGSRLYVRERLAKSAAP